MLDVSLGRDHDFFARCVRERGRDSLSIALTAYLLEVKIYRLMWVSVSHVLAMD